MIFVLLSGGQGREQSPDDYGHLGFACASRDEVDRVASDGRAEGCLVWEPRASLIRSATIAASGIPTVCSSSFRTVSL